MPTIRKTTPGESMIHNHGRVSGGETIDVDGDTAEYLTENGGYEYVDETNTDSAADEDVCGEELTDGGICERPPDECPYHAE